MKATSALKLVSHMYKKIRIIDTYFVGYEDSTIEAHLIWIWQKRK